MSTPESSWYDHPQYFDMAFRDETPAEVAFLQAAWRTYLGVPADASLRLYEPGCGSGRLVVAMASKGHHVIGLDQNEAMAEYLWSRIRRGRLIGARGGSAQCVVGDMVHHVVDPPVDAAFCTFNTFRHLTNHQDAVAHLRSVASSLRPGGLYVLGFHCLPMDVDPESTERWTSTHGGTRVSVTFRVTSFHRRARREHIRVSIKATTATGRITRVRSEFDLRLYTPRQAIALLADVDDVFELVAIHDFDYDIETTRRVDGDLIDAVFILRRTVSSSGAPPGADDDT